MSLIRENLRLAELAAVVRANEPFHHELLEFLRRHGYESLHSFVEERDDPRALAVISDYLGGRGGASLYDGILRPYEDRKARWYYLAWLFRDAPAQRLGPLVSGGEGSLIARRAELLNDIRNHVRELFPDPESWDWPATSEVMLARLEGSRRALKGTLFEGVVREALRELFQTEQLELVVSDAEVRIGRETYDVTVTGSRGAILLPVKTRETMGGGHALLFTRDIRESISAAVDAGFGCIPIVIAESWSGDLEALRSGSFIHVSANPNQLLEVAPLLKAALRDLLPQFQALSS